MSIRRQSSTSYIQIQSGGSNNTAVGEPPHRIDACNIVIFGESGAGKSSLVNLIAGEDVAVTSSDAKGCTTTTNEYGILIQNGTLKVKLFDTPGLDESSQAEVSDKKARRILKKLIQNLMKQGDIHLIIYCVRGERGIQALRRNYKLIHSQIKSKVPIVLVITGLESYGPDMEEWWRLNEYTISKLSMTFSGHACITTAMTTQSNVTERHRKQSYDAVCKLIEQCRLSNETVVYSGPSRGPIHNVPSKITASNKHTNIVLFGQSGAGKSSLVNLMAGKNVASTSSAMGCCTLHWQEHPIEFDGGSYRVFDTVGLEEPRLGVSQYLDAVENAYKLIQYLESRDGIDLLLFCMRAGRLTDTLQSNYRLFHEFLCDKKVPIVVVITHLENEVGKMDNWWMHNRATLHAREIHVAGHACITAIQGNYPERYEESRTTIRKLVKEFTAEARKEFTTEAQKETWIGGDNTFVSFVSKLRGLLVGKEKLHLKKDIVPRLVKRCGLSADVATKLANRIKNGLIERAT